MQVGKWKIPDPLVVKSHKDILLNGGLKPNNINWFFDKTWPLRKKNQFQMKTNLNQSLQCTTLNQTNCNPNLALNEVLKELPLQHLKYQDPPASSWQKVSTLRSHREGHFMSTIKRLILHDLMVVMTIAKAAFNVRWNLFHCLVHGQNNRFFRLFTL